MIASWSITRVSREALAAYRASPNRWFIWLAIGLGLFAFLLEGSFMSTIGSLH